MRAPQADPSLERPGNVVTAIASAADVVRARQEGRALAARIGFEGSELAVIATAISELARNILQYAQSGELTIAPAQDGVRRGIQIQARDSGPGIADVARALQAGFTTGNGLGMGLPGVRRLMDEFEVASTPRGTTVRVRKWLP